MESTAATVRSATTMTSAALACGKCGIQEQSQRNNGHERKECF
jgi:hypothetical protein